MSLLALQQNFRTWLTSESAEVEARFEERARAGLGVYLNNYRAQLVACLSASFPVLRAWMGDAAFEGAAASHIDNVPPHAWTLDAYGLDFHETLRRLYPTDPEIAELARLERELESAFVGPDSALVDPAALADVDWDAAVIQFVPTLRLLSVTTNAAAIWSAISNGETPPAAELLPEPASLAIWRQHLAPRFRRVTADEAAAICEAREGQTFGSLCADWIERHGEEQGPALAGALLGQWLSDGWIADVRKNPLFGSRPAGTPATTCRHGYQDPVADHDRSDGR
jgi:hypothetical protein